MNKVQRVSAIKNGTVIDHIPPESTFKVVQILRLGNESVTIGHNLSSKKMGKKGIVKIAGKALTKDELDKIALVAPHASVAVIKDYKAARKFKVELPDEFVGVVKCFNPNCITRHQEVTTRFHVINEQPLKLKCHHCERTAGKDDIILL